MLAFEILLPKFFISVLTFNVLSRGTSKFRSLTLTSTAYFALGSQADSDIPAWHRDHDGQFRHPRQIHGIVQRLPVVYCSTSALAQCVILIS